MPRWLAFARYTPLHPLHPVTPRYTYVVKWSACHERVWLVCPLHVQTLFYSEVVWWYGGMVWNTLFFRRPNALLNPWDVDTPSYRSPNVRTTVAAAARGRMVHWRMRPREEGSTTSDGRVLLKQSSNALYSPSVMRPDTTLVLLTARVVDPIPA